jgi:hypothetical protein
VFERHSFEIGERRMAVITRTHTKTFTLLDDWAATIPHDCKGCGKPHVHVHDLCAVPSCGGLLHRGEQVYAVIQTGGPDAPEPVPCEVNPQLTTADCHHAEQWVCWRHIRPDDGPIKI